MHRRTERGQLRRQQVQAGSRQLAPVPRITQAGSRPSVGARRKRFLGRKGRTEHDKPNHCCVLVSPGYRTQYTATLNHLAPGFPLRDAQGRTSRSIWRNNSTPVPGTEPPY